MRWLKTIVFLILAAGASQVAYAQAHDSFSGDRNDPFKAVRLYPNPATEVVSIKFEKPQARTVKLTLHNIIGNEVPVEEEIVDDYEILLKVKDLPTGYYLLAVKNQENQRGSFKFLKL